MTKPKIGVIISSIRPTRFGDKPAKWIAFISGALFEWGASEMIQVENHPDFKSKNTARSPR